MRDERTRVSKEEVLTNDIVGEVIEVLLSISQRGR